MKKIFVFVISIMLICLAATCLWGCKRKKSNKNESSPPAEEEVSILLSRTEASLDIEETLKLSVISNAKDTSKFVWTSSNSSVATVSGSGEVTAKSVGTAAITVSYGNVSQSCSITVYDSYPYPVISIVDKNLRLAVGDTYNINAKVIYMGTERNVTITYITENSAVATVSQDGTITATGVGLVKITIKATYENTSLQETIDLAVLSNSLV